MITKRSLFYWILVRQPILQLFLFFFILIGVVFHILPLEIQKRLIDDVIIKKQENLLLIYCGIFFGAMLLAVLLKRGVTVIREYIGQKVLMEIRIEMYKHILSLPVTFFRHTPPHVVVKSISDELDTVGKFIGSAISIPVASVLTFGAIIAYMIHLHPLMTIISLSFYFFEIIALPVLYQKINRMNALQKEVAISMNGTVSESISGILEIKGNSTYNFESDKFDFLAHKLFALTKHSIMINYAVKCINGLFRNLGAVVLLGTGGLFVIRNEISLGALIVFIAAYLKIYEPRKELLDYYRMFKQAKIQYHHVMGYFDNTPQPTQEITEIKRMRGKIEAIQLGYVTETGIVILDQIDFALEPGHMLGLVGTSGSGKSTLAMLIANMYKNYSGKILIDGREMSNLSPNDISRNIGLVMKNPFIFSGTLLENLLYGCSLLKEPPKRETILEIVHDVEFADDLIDFALNTIVPPAHMQKITEMLIRIRFSIHKQMPEELPMITEFYDLNKFLDRLPIYDNILFCDSKNSDYQPENIGENIKFLHFISKIGIDEVLLKLGYDIAKETVSLLKNTQTDPYFFRYTPVHPEEFDMCEDIVSHCERSDEWSLNKKERTYLIVIALRYVSDKHKLVKLSESLKTKIIRSRLVFLQEAGEFDCVKYTMPIVESYNDPSELPKNSDTNFAFFCSGNCLPKRSILENILFGSVIQGNDAQVGKVKAKIIEMIQNENRMDDLMEIGLSYSVGSRGNNLTDMQKQKVALIRAFLKDAPIIILDEAFSSLPVETLNHIRKNLFEKRCKGKHTVIAVLNRSDMVSHCDKIMVLKAGQVVEMGTYEELMNKKGAIYEFVHGT